MAYGVKNLTAYVGLFSVFNHIKDLVTGAIKKNFEYSGSLTDIRKVSGLTMEQVKQLSTELAKIDTRTSVDGLHSLRIRARSSAWASMVLKVWPSS